MTLFDEDGRFGRREAIQSLGSLIAVGFLSECGGGETGSPAAASPATSGNTTSAATTNAQCVVTPAETEGPYFVDERLNRSDIRSDPSSGVVRAGVPLDLTLVLSQIGAAASACTPLVGALVDMWHCDALGAYSDISQQGTVGQEFLRGYQTSDAGGRVRFTTIFPGWYPGRAVHIHFKVRTNPDGASGLEFTSQMFFDEALTDAVHAQVPYSSKGRRNTTLATDGIYQGGGTSLIVPLSGAGGGYAGTFFVGVRV
jgi:protocatechuate 3,4-dioxygenase beta subunit